MRYLLPSYLVLVLLITAAGGVANYYEHHHWKMGDWLANYGGGFVRRGLIGEIFLVLSRATSINPGVFVVFAQMLFYALFFFFSYLLLKRVRLIKYLLLIMSPFIFTFQLNDFSGGYRKEVIYFAMFSFLGYAKVTYSKAVFEKVFFASLLVYTIAVLGHEGLAVFLPYFWALYIFNNTLSLKKYCLLIVFSLPVCVAFLLCTFFYPGTIAQQHAIFNALSNLNYSIDGGAISWCGCIDVMNRSALLYNLDFFAERIRCVVTALALSLIAFVPVYANLYRLFKNKVVLLLVLSVIGVTVAGAIYSYDWGRLIYFQLVSFFILALVADDAVADPDSETQSLKPSYIAMILFGLVWGMMFRIPCHCVGNVVAQNTLDLNLFNYIKPLLLQHR